MITFAALAILSGISISMFLSFALGVASMVGKNGNWRNIPFIQLGIMFVSILLLWIFFRMILPSGWMGFSEYFLFFPCSALVCIALEYIAARLLPKFESRTFRALTGYDGLVFVPLLITINLAANFLQAFVLVFFFILGNLAAMLVLGEIRRRSSLEKVPVFLRGSPLVLISMGLLSLITGTIAVICFKILEMAHG